MSDKNDSKIGSAVFFTVVVIVVIASFATGGLALIPGIIIIGVVGRGSGLFS